MQSILSPIIKSVKQSPLHSRFHINHSTCPYLQQRPKKKHIFTEELGDPSLRRLGEVCASGPSRENVFPGDGCLGIHARGNGAEKTRESLSNGERFIALTAGKKCINVAVNFWWLVYKENERKYEERPKYFLERFKTVSRKANLYDGDRYES